MKIRLLFLALIALHAQAHAQLVNLDFEEWDTTDVGQLYPTAWNSLQQRPCTQVNTAQSGDHALMVSVWYYYVDMMTTQVAAISDRPTALDGYYIYTDNEQALSHTADGVIITDTAWVKVFLTKWNGGSMQRDTIGSGALWLGNSLSYAQFHCPLQYVTADVPDSITITIDPSLATGTGGDYNAVSLNGYCSFLTLDNFSLAAETGIAALTERPSALVYPVPARDVLTVELPTSTACSLHISDAAGRTMLTTGTVRGKQLLSIAALPSGSYLLVTTDAQGRVLARQLFAKE